jgi:hypothetical protein
MLPLCVIFLDHAITLGVVSGICKLGAFNASTYNICRAAAKKGKKNSKKQKC